MHRGPARVVIAHRGASGYLPEHTQEAKVLAHGMGADYLEQDIVLTGDDELLVLHDVELDRVTDVAQRYPGRARADGRYYARDFTLAEIRALAVTERLAEDGRTAVYPQRFPAHLGRFRLHTLGDEIALLHGLNRARGSRTGLYIEIKRPAWHRAEGGDPGAAVLGCLAQCGVAAAQTPVYLQCFDSEELRRLRAIGTPWPLVQLLAPVPCKPGGWLGPDPLTAEGLRAMAEVAAVVAPWLGHVWHRGRDTGFTRLAQEAGLQVHPWTLQGDALPPGAHDFSRLLHCLWHEVGVDGMFTDFPDRAVAARDHPTR
jgi:glycerophosphoryl diester phosphodiesterase